MRDCIGGVIKRILVSKPLTLMMIGCYTKQLIHNKELINLVRIHPDHEEKCVIGYTKQLIHNKELINLVKIHPDHEEKCVIGVFQWCTCGN